ncbi:MAG: phosphoribosyltransferase family protein [Waterburya sp.]
MNAVFSNRLEAGRRLAKQLTCYFNHPQAIVLGLPRGGVAVAYEIAKNLNLPLDVCLVKKLGLPDYPEVAMGAIAEDALIHDYSGKITVIDEDMAQRNNVAPEQIQAIASRVKAELRWRDSCYRHCRPMLKIKGSLVIVVDDGIATGLTMHAAVSALQQQQPQKIIIATPVALPMALKQLETVVDEITCLVTSKSLNAVGFWYEDFSQVTDQEVCDLLCQETHKDLAESY